MMANVDMVHTKANLFVAKRGREGVETNLNVVLKTNPAQSSRSQSSLIPDAVLVVAPWAVVYTVFSLMCTIPKSVSKCNIMF